MRSMICASCCALLWGQGLFEAGSVRFGDKVSFYHDVAQILHQLRSAGVVIAACSRTTATDL
jgi:hypothetical protein